MAQAQKGFELVNGINISCPAKQTRVTGIEVLMCIQITGSALTVFSIGYQDQEENIILIFLSVRSSLRDFLPRKSQHRLMNYSSKYTQ